MTIYRCPAGHHWWDFLDNRTVLGRSVPRWKDVDPSLLIPEKLGDVEVAFCPMHQPPAPGRDTG